MNEEKMKFKTKIVHKIEWINGSPYYLCNHAVGVLSGQQIILKTNACNQNKVTCKNCMKHKNYKKYKKHK